MRTGGSLTRAGLAIAWTVLASCPAFAETVVRDIAYAAIPDADARLTSLDIYLPEDGRMRPVVIYVHGGGWMRGDKARVEHKARAFVEAGYVFVSVNYRLSPDATHPAHVRDVAAAVAWVRDNIDARRGDPKRLFLLGHSAGAHLVALAATDTRHLEAAGCPPGALSGVICLDGGAYDMAMLRALNERVARGLLEPAFGLDPKTHADASPINYVAPDKPIPPFLLIHAGDRLMSRLQAEAFARELRGADVHVVVRHAPDHDHASLNRRLGAPGDPVMDWVLGFLDECRFPAEGAPR